MTTLTRRYKFASSHRLHAPTLSEAENCEIYGKCNNPWGHGHDYVLEVTVAGKVERRTGRVVSPELLDRYVHERVVSRFDHRDMNRDIAVFQEKVPTAENIAEAIEDMLLPDWHSVFPGTELHRLRIEETRRNFVELRKA